MKEKSYQDAVQALKSQLGGQWQGEELAGRDEMVKILKERLGYDSAAAPLTPPGEGMVSGIPAAGGLSGMPIAAGFLPGLGYWQVGEDQDEASAGRAGQVQTDY